ncbi:MAG: hypothetical protein K5917_04605 [Clostridiales bacterium]|nr:hypothetical protein [Clostridiales bacterium]
MDILSKGQIFEEFIGQPSCMRWDIDKNGAKMIVQLSSDLIESFKLGGHYDFACVPINDILFFCARWNNSEWLSAPFSPHLSQSFSFQEFKKGEGMPLNVLLICTDTGELIDMDFMGLGTDFSNKVYELNKKLYSKPFNADSYFEDINRVYSEYANDEELVKLSDIKYSID